MRRSDSRTGRASRFRPAVLTVSLFLLAASPSLQEARADEKPPKPDKVSIPIGVHERRGEALPAGSQIELSLQRAIVLALENTLDLDVASLSYERAGFGIGSANGAFDPLLSLDLQIADTKSPVTSLTQTGAKKSQSANTTFSGIFETGTRYTARFNNSRSDSVGGFTTINPTFNSTLSLAVTQPLLRDFGPDFGRTVNRRLIVQARIARDVSAWGFVNTVETTIQTVENAYWDLVYALGNLTAKREALERAKDFNRITKIKIDVGALAPIEIVQTEVSIAQREQDIITAEGQIGDAQDRLKRLLNVKGRADWDRPIVPSDLPSDEPVAVDLEKGLRSALEIRPEVKQAVVDIESKKISLAYNRNQLQPRLDLSLSYSHGGVGAQKSRLVECNGPLNPDGTCPPEFAVVRTLNYIDAIYQIRDRDFPSWSAGLSLSVPIFNRTAKAAASQASTELELSRTNLAILKQNLQVEVRSAARGIDTAFRTVAAARKSRELAERNLDAEKKKYDNGMTTSFTVAQVQNDLTAARSQELLAIANYRKAVVGWQKSTGELLSVKGISIAGLPVTLDPTPAEEGALR